MMKKQYFMLAVFMVALFAMTAVSSQAAVSKFARIEVTLINQEPDPVAPGNSFDVRFRIENQGSAPAEDVIVKLVTDFPFSVYEDMPEKNIGTIEGSQTDEIGVREKWKLFVDPKAATGESTIEFWYKAKNSVWTKAGDYTLNIRSTDAFLAINEIKTDKNKIIPGTTTKVSFVLENLADNTLQNIKLNLQTYTETVTATGISVNELPFSPIGSGNEKTIRSLSKGEKSSIDFNLFTDADAENKVYKVPYTLVYQDSSGEDYTREGVVGLMVDSVPELSINIDKNNIYSAGAKGNVEIKIVNKGFSDIKFLDVLLEGNEEFEVLSNPDVYIGKLDSDDYETAEYELMINKDVKEKVVLPLNIEYRDANGQLFQKEMPLEIKLFTGEELKKRQNGQSSPLVPIIVVVVVLVAGFFIWRARSKKSKKKA
jgi:hypothetical protein